jgi:uncharacterized protein (TIGR00255 family)
MIVSMTGFGKASLTFENKTIKTEIRSLNSKNLDLAVKMPALFRDKENTVRSLVSNRLERGKVELSVTMEYSNGQMAQSLNTPLLMHYYKEINKLQKR